VIENKIPIKLVLSFYPFHDFFYQVSLKDVRVRSGGGDLKWGYVLENLFKNI